AEPKAICCEPAPHSAADDVPAKPEPRSGVEHVFSVRFDRFADSLRTMTTGQVDLGALLRGMANRDASRTEANVQSDLHTFLIAPPLELEDRHLETVLEQQAGGGHRIDVEHGLCVFEVKRDLRKGNVRAQAEVQLAGYVAARSATMRQRYVGVLTDGA